MASDGLDDEGLHTAWKTLQSMLIPGESIQAFAVQRRLFALSHRRVMVAATTGRLLGISRRLIGGFTPIDLRWQDLKSVGIEAGVFGSDLTVAGLRQLDLTSTNGNRTDLTVTFEGLRKEEAQAVYRVCQSQEQAWREKRRLRELEELRAQSGGFQTTVPNLTNVPDELDPIGRLRRAKDMLDQGLISDTEYETVKARIVGQI